MDLPKEAIRFKKIREEVGMTQSAFASALNIKNTTADIERGRTRLPGHVVMKLMQDYQINPLWLYGQSDMKKIYPKDISPKMISIDNLGNENILLVNEKAAAGYAGNLGDPTFYEQLPAFTFPTPEYRNATFRGFQIEGDSMIPVAYPDDWILAKAIQHFDEIRNEQFYIIVQEDSIRFKKVLKSDKLETLILISTNEAYDVDQVQYRDIKEVWEFHSKVSQNIQDQSTSNQLATIYQEILRLKQTIREGK